MLVPKNCQRDVGQQRQAGHDQPDADPERARRGAGSGSRADARRSAWPCADHPSCVPGRADERRTVAGMPRDQHRRGPGGRGCASIPPTIFSEMSALAVRTGASTSGRGSPTGTVRAGAVEAAVEALRAGRNQYAARPRRPRAARGGRRAPGPALRHRPRPRPPRWWSPPARPRRSRPRSSRWSNPGDEVVVLEPYYDSYVACIEMAGGVRRPVTLRAPDFRLDVDALRAAVTDRGPRDPAVNTPHNPTGAVLDPRRARGGRRGRGRARPGGGHRRGLRAPAVRRPRARPALHPAGHVGPHGVRSPAPARRSPSPAGRSAG